MQATVGMAGGGPDLGDGGPFVSLYSPLPEYLEVGRGQYLVVAGDCTSSRRIERVVIGFAGRGLDAELSPIPGGVSFWQAILVTPECGGRNLPVTLSVRFRSGAPVDQALGEIRVRGLGWNPVEVPGPCEDSGLIAICMATYNPELAAFARQVESIRRQTHRDWICIVNDDGTPPGSWREMRELCAADHRFVMFRNTSNLGFYRNFEQALKRVPGTARYVAFADQDDAWYPEKLKRLVEALETKDATLAYSDMRIVDETGKELAPTYWVNRRNEYQDLKVVLVANTVTGAASLFRREVLDDLLPFPPRVGDAFHDHWLACVALATGTLAYVDRPLHDYYQYGSSVIGHCDFVRFTMGQRLVSLLRFLLRLSRPGTAVPLLRRKYASALAIYRGECRRLRLVEGTLRARCALSSGRRRQLRNFDGGARSLVRLLNLHARVLVKGQTTDDAELRLAMGELARIVEKRRYRRRHATH